MTIPVVHWGTGETGRMALRGIVLHPDLELVGVHVARPERAGRDAGEVCGFDPVGVLTTNDAEALLALDATCLSYFGNGGAADVLPFLRAGRNVVTTSLASLILAEWAPAAEREPVEAACAEGGASLFATGTEPGVGSDLLPLTLLTCAQAVRSVRVQEIANYGRYAVEPIMRAWGFGNLPDEPVLLFQGDGPIRLWGGVVHHLAHELGVTLDDVRLVTDTAVTDHDIETACYTVKAGTVAAVRFEVQGMLRGRPFAVLEHVNFVGGPEVAPHWPRGRDGQDTVYRVEIDGLPPIRAEVDLDYDHATGEDSGLIATAMRAVNAIPVLQAARPGILGPMEVPPLPCRVILP